jgi:hypothetical protein
MGNQDLIRGVDGIRLVSTITSSLIGIRGRSEESSKQNKKCTEFQYQFQ